MPTLPTVSELVKMIEELRAVGVSRFRISSNEVEVWLGEESHSLDFPHLGSPPEEPDPSDEELLFHSA